MTTQQHDTMAMTDHELEQVNGGFPVWLILPGPFILWGAFRLLDGLDEVEDPADGSKKRSCK